MELASWERNVMRAAAVGMLLLCGLLLCGLAVFSVNVIDLIDMELIEFCIKWCAELQAWVKNLYTVAQEIVRPSPPVAAALTVSLVLFVFMLLVLLLRAETWRPVNTVAQKNLDVPIIPRPAVPAAEDEHPDRMVGTRPVQTLLGPLAFQTTHEIGKVGDVLTVKYYVRRGYKKMKSKRGKVHGIDGVYVHLDRQEVVIVENKINKSAYKPHQLSIAGVESQCHKMLKSKNAEIRETAELILQAAASGSGKCSLIRLVLRHNLRTGKSTRWCVDDLGNRLGKHGGWQNKWDMEEVLNNVITKGLAWPCTAQAKRSPTENGGGLKNDYGNGFGPRRYATNSIGLELIEIPAGKFTMGSPAGEKGRQPDEEQVGVTLTKPFFLGKTEVTQGQWKQVMGTEPWEGQDDVQVDKDCPATFVSFFDAVEFCETLTDLERKDGKLKANEEYRLPTEAEWEYACRAGTTKAYSFGDGASKLGEYGWFNGNTFGERYAHKVGLKKPNPWGLHDVHGNVWEWCSDWFDAKISGGIDPGGPDGGSRRVGRGGCWRSYAPPGGVVSVCRSAYRGYFGPSWRYMDSVGFRVARSQSAQ